MTITFERIGGGDAGPSSPLTIPHSATVNAGDLAIIVKCTRNDNDAADTTPSGWTLIDTLVGGTGSFGSGTGNARVTAWYRECDGTEDSANTSITWNTGTSGAVTTARYLYFSKTLANWVTPVSVSGADSSSGTGLSVTGGSLEQAAGDMIVGVAAVNTNTTLSSPAFATTGVTYDTVINRISEGAAGGNLGTIFASSGAVTAGATGAPTFSATLGTASAGAGLIIRLREENAAAGGTKKLMTLGVG